MDDDRWEDDPVDEGSRRPRGRTGLAVGLALLVGIGVGVGGMYWAVSKKMLPVAAATGSGDAHEGDQGDRHSDGQEASTADHRGGHGGGNEGGHDNGKAPAATVELAPRQVAVAGVKSEPVEPRGLTKEIRAVGKLDFDEQRLATVSARIAGRVDKLYVNFTGIHVMQGEKLLDIYSPDLVSTQQEYLLALKNRDRVRESPLPEVLDGANSLVAASRRRLLLWGISEKQIAELEREGEGRIHMTVYSPATGTVIEKKVLEGKYVAAGEPLYVIADLATLWLFAEVYESELGLVRLGQPVEVTVPSYPGRAFQGRVSFINPVLEPQTRTAKVRVELPNRDGLLKPQMFAHATLRVPIGAAVLAVPASAVLDTGTKQYAWVERGPGQYERREIRLGAEVNGFYQVLGGLDKGERVVTAANFLIDSQAQLKAGGAAGGPGGHGGH